MTLRPDDDIALEIGRRIVAWMRNPTPGLYGVFPVMGDNVSPYGWEIRVLMRPEPKCCDPDCEVCYPVERTERP